VYRNNLQEQARNYAPLKIKSGPRQRFPGTRHHRYRCSLPGLAEFTVDRREEADADRGRLSMLSTRDTTTRIRGFTLPQRLGINFS
jgi:hypothetical protein